MRMTKKRLEMLSEALAYHETVLFEDEGWIGNFKSEAEARKVFDATQQWVWQELGKRGA